MYCIHCGTKNEGGTKFCYKCGMPLRTDLAIDKAEVPHQLPTHWQGIKQWLLCRKLAAIAGLTALILVLALGAYAVISAVTTNETPSLRSQLTPQATRAVESVGATFRIESAQHFMTEDDFAKLASIGTYFTNPRTRDVITHGITISMLFTTPSNYDGKTVTVTGKVLKKTLVLDVLPDGWPTSYYLIIVDGTDVMPALYRGDAQAISVGDTIRITGLFSKAGGGLNADAVQKADILARLMARPVLLLIVHLIAGIVVLFLLLFSVRFLWRTLRQAKLKLVNVGQTNTVY